MVLTPGNFLEEGGFKEKADKAKWYIGPIPADYILSKGDLIVAMTEQAEGLLGSGALIPRSGVYLHNQRLGFVQIQGQQQADRLFIYYLFNSKPVRQQIRGSASGTKIRHTAPSRIADVKISVPPLPVQQRIAGILSAYDELIENSQRRIKILEAMAHALYSERRSGRQVLWAGDWHSRQTASVNLPNQKPPPHPRPPATASALRPNRSRGRLTMSAHACSEDQFVEHLAIRHVAVTIVLFESLPAPRRKCMSCQYFLFEWKTSE